MQDNHKTKILYLITKSSWGGAQRYVYDLATGLDKNLFESEVITGGQGTLVDMLQAAQINVTSISDLKRNISLKDELLAFFKIIKLVRKAKPDVLHVNSSKAGAMGALIGRLCRVKKIIFTAHGWAFNEDRPTWQKIIIKLIHWLTVLLSHKTITVSTAMKKEMDWPLAQKKMITIHPGRAGIEMKYKEEARGSLETKIIDNAVSLSDYHSDFWIGTIAELHPIKRLNRAIDAISVLTKDFPNLRFIIVHDGQLKETLQQQVRDLNLEKNVFFTGLIPEAARFLKAFDLFVLPSKSESFGYVLLEAGQAALPVVATEVGGITDIIKNEENGLLVPPDDTPALTKAMRRLIEDKNLRHTISQNHFMAVKEFTLEKMIEKTENIYTAS